MDGSAGQVNDKNRSAMDPEPDPYRQPLLALESDLSDLAEKHGRRLLAQAARNATRSEVLQRIAEDLARRSEEDTAAEDEGDGRHPELSEATEEALSDLMDRFTRRA